MRTTCVRAALMVAIVLTISLLAGCSGDGPSAVTSAWPVADVERVVPKPASLVRWPLTGLPAPDAQATQVRAVAVKIENSPESRPQSNLHTADVVYETLTEGGITRFNAIYHSQAPDNVGPVRSARLSDAYIVPQYQGLFSHVGGNTVVLARVRSAGINDMDEFANSGPYWRSSARPRPHNVYMDITALREAATSRGYDATRTIPAFAFELLPDALTPEIVEIDVPFAPGNKVTWQYDADTDMYMRSINGRTHGDAVSGEQYTTKNMVVLWARTSATAKRDVTGSVTLDIQLNGSGPASVFRNGLRFDGEWETDGTEPPRFTEEDGSVIRLSPGRTWMQVVTSSTNISTK